MKHQQFIEVLKYHNLQNIMESSLNNEHQTKTKLKGDVAILYEQCLSVFISAIVCL